METASTAGLDRMLFIEAERMANCVYDPDDCESERTVIISELQGGENDPDTLLEQEVIPPRSRFIRIGIQPSAGCPTCRA